jgi:hypothetical protein
VNKTSKKLFRTTLIFLVPQIVKLMVKKAKIPEEQAVQSFYKSKVYSFLEQEETKVWHFSPLTLYNMYQQEVETGNFEFPEEC